MSIGDHSHLPMFVAMAEGKIRGFMAMGQNPAVGGQNASFQRRVLAKLDWLVVRDLYETETATFWKDSPEVKAGEVKPEDIATEVFLLPAAATAEMDGTYTNTQRLIQWHDRAADPPGDARSDLWFSVHLGLKLKQLYAGSPLEKGRPIQALTWNYIDPHENSEWRIKDEPSATLVLKEMNGYHVATGKPVKGFGDLKADGSTACGAWIYSGVYAPTPDRPEGQNRAANRNGDDWVALGWAFAWPANRRILYNRAAADPKGNPWPKEARLAREFGNGAKGYAYWDPDAEGPDPSNPAKVVRGRWVGLDVPDFPVTKPPTASARPDGLGLDFHDGASPFLMKADGKAWLFAPSGLVDGPLPAHYEPYESPVTNLVYPARSSNPTAKVFPVPGNPYASVASAEYPCVLSTLSPHRGPPQRLDEPMASLAGRSSARAVRRDQPRTCRRDRRREPSDRPDHHPPRRHPRQGPRHPPHPSLPDRRQDGPSRGHALALGLQGHQQGRRRQRPLRPRRRPQCHHPQSQGLRVPGGDDLSVVLLVLPYEIPRELASFSRRSKEAIGRNPFEQIRFHSVFRLASLAFFPSPHPVSRCRGVPAPVAPVSREHDPDGQRPDPGLASPGFVPSLSRRRGGIIDS